MSLRPFLVVTALAAALTGCAERSAPVVDSTPGSAAILAPRTLAQTPFERTWDLHLPGPVHTAWASPNVPELLFFQMAGERHEIIAVDALSGATRWVTQALPEGLRLPPYAARVHLPTDKNDVFLNDDRLYVVAKDTLFVFDIATGHLIWRYELPFSPSTGPLAVGLDASLRVFLGDWSGRMQVVSYHQDKGFPFPVWQWPLGTSISAQGVDREELIYAGDHAGVLHCFKLDREQAWSHQVGGGIHGTPLIRERVLYTGSTDNVLVAINRLTGEPMGQLNLGAPVVRTPFAFRGETQRIYAWTGLEGGPQTLVAIHAQPDTIAYTDTARHPLEVVRLAVDWQRPGFDILVGSTPEYLYGTTTGSTMVQALNRRTGNIDWTWDPAAEPKQAPIDCLMTYQDPADLVRSIIVIGQDGSVAAHRFFGYVPGDRSAPAAAPAAPTAAPAAPVKP